MLEIFKPVFNSERFSERADLCDCFVLKLCCQVERISLDMKDSDCEIPRANQIALNKNQP